MLVLKSVAGERTRRASSASTAAMRASSGSPLEAGEPTRGKRAASRRMRTPVDGRAWRRRARSHDVEDSRAIPPEQASIRAQSDAWRRAPRSASRGSARPTSGSLPRSSIASRSPTSICAASCGSVSRSATGGARSRTTSSRRWCSGGRWWCRTSPTLEAAPPLAQALATGAQPRMIVGHRASVMALHNAFRPPRPARELRDPQPLLVLDRGDLAGTPSPDVRLSTRADLEALIVAAARMHREEMGIDPLAVDAPAWRNADDAASSSGAGAGSGCATGEVLFKAELSAWTPDVVQIQGVYTAPQHRGQGIARAGLAAVCAQVFTRRPALQPVRQPVQRDRAARVRAARASGRRTSSRQ